jgi:hypothetical protein
MRLVRELENVTGNVWWPAWSLVRNSANMQTQLRDVYQKYPSLVPAYTWLDNVAPKGVTHLKKHGNVIVWEQNSAEAANPMQKALFYAVYCFPKGVKADISNSEYLVKLTNKNSFDVQKENKNHKGGCKYVVTVIDRCWNESNVSKAISF